MSEALQANEDVPESNSTTKEGTSPSRNPIWETAVELGNAIPDKELEQLPTDGARNLDSYLYKSPNNNQ